MLFAWCATGFPSQNWSRTGLSEKVKVVRGDVQDQALLERMLGEYEIDTVIHLAAQTIVPHRESQSGVNVRYEHRAARGRCWKRAVAARWSSKLYWPRRIRRMAIMIVALHGRRAAAGTSPVRRQQVVRGSDRPVICHHLWSPGGYHSLWKLLRRRRSELESYRCPGTIRSVLRGQRPVIRSDGQHIRDYFYVEDGAAVYMLLAESWRSDPN